MKLENIKLNLDTELVLNVGDPIGKTNAPRCYNKLFERLHMNAIMLPCEIKKGELPKLLDACRLMGIHYLCPTMPHKSDFVDLLDDVDETSKLFHSVTPSVWMKTAATVPAWTARALSRPWRRAVPS